MDYQEALAFIHNIARFGTKPGLSRVSMLLERMGNPQKQLRFVHVAGTNGKGSTCTMLSHILTRAGYRTGLYISPFVLDFRERVQLNNQMISREELAASTTLVKSHWDVLDAMGDTPSEFEVVVAVAMDYFLRQRCDIVVLEVGMGGRFDATNVIDAPLVSVITSIGIDHTEYLGDTLAKIAFEKCGIIKEGGATVCYTPQEAPALAVIEEQAALKHNRLITTGEASALHMDITGSRFAYQGEEYFVALAGPHQIRNAVTVLEAVKVLNLTGFHIPLDAVMAGMGEVRFPARLEILGQEPLVLLDGAHNLSGAQALAEALKLLDPGRAVHAVVGMLADKDVTGVLEAVLPRCASVVAMAPPSPRAMPANELRELATKHCAVVTAADSPQAAVATGLGRCGRGDVLLLFGSLYLASGLRPIAVEQIRQHQG